MKRNIITALGAIFALTAIQSAAFAHGGEKHVKLHINPRWSECSFQLDAALTQQAWRQFTKEAGLVIYFRALKDAKPMGAGNYEASILQWGTSFDDTQPAWNDTFVHPDSVHWLKESPALQIPGLTLRAGLTENIDAAAYVTKAPGANYGFWGGQVQYNFVDDTESNWAASTRVSFVSLYGPEDFDMTVYGVDVVASREYAVYSDWISVMPYGGVSAYLSRTHEKSNVVALQDENVVGVQGTLGIGAQISSVRLAAEYNVAALNTFSIRLGVGF